MIKIIKGEKPILPGNRNLYNTIPDMAILPAVPFEEICGIKIK
jgi:hypothetical protein